MIILTKQERVALRSLFDHDKNDVFETFLKKLRLEILKKPAVGDTEFETVKMAISRDAQFQAINLILEQMNEEISNISVKDE